MSKIKAGDIFYKHGTYDIGIKKDLPIIYEYKVTKVTPKIVWFNNGDNEKIDYLGKYGYLPYSKDLENERAYLQSNIELYRFYYRGKFQNDTACRIIANGNKELIEKARQLRVIIERDFNEFLA